MNTTLQMKPGLLILALLFFFALTIGMSRNLAAADKAGTVPLQKVMVAYSSISGNNAPLWVTQERGFFKKYGLDVQSVLIESGSTSAQSLIAGDVSFAHMAGAAIMQSNLRGADAVMIAGVINTLTFQLYTDKSISRPDQFKGKTVGVTRFGSSTDFAMRYALEKYGLDPNKDLTILQLGNVPALLAALEAGKIQGAMLSAPTTLRAKKLGYPMLADLQMLGLEYQHTGIATTRSLIKSKPELVRDFMRAYVEGIHYAKTHRRETLEILTKYLRTDDKDILDDTYDSIALNLVPEKPYPTLKGIQIILRELGIKDPNARSAKPEQFVDLTFIKELDSSGFIDRLYKSAAVAKAAPSRPEPLPAPEIVKEKAAPAEAKGKAVTAEEKAKPVAKQIPFSTERSAATPVTAKATSPASQEYTVKAGDTLSKLSERFYNSPYKWEKIYDANRDSVKNPHYIYIGQKLMIPSDDQAG
jgi:ABC-type nitrate/sulfonate/bicarbonate transport system substrate-binding protein/LysM repeat protein